PQRGHVHHFVENPLAQSALAEEADRYPVAPRALGGKGRAGGNPGTTGHDGVGPQVAALLVGDVHRSALPAAIPRRLAQAFAEHAHAVHFRLHLQVLIPVHRLLFLWALASVLGSSIASFRSPARCAITSHTAAKSWWLIPIDRAADSDSLVTAVVGGGTDVC